MTTLFALFTEVVGRPKGSLGVSRLDGKDDEIRHFLELGVAKTAIAKITGVRNRLALGVGREIMHQHRRRRALRLPSRTALYSFMSTRGFRPGPARLYFRTNLVGLPLSGVGGGLSAGCFKGADGDGRYGPWAASARPADPRRSVRPLLCSPLDQPLFAILDRP